MLKRKHPIPYTEETKNKRKMKPHIHNRSTTPTSNTCCQHIRIKSKLRKLYVHYFVNKPYLESSRDQKLYRENCCDQPFSTRHIHHPPHLHHFSSLSRLFKSFSAWYSSLPTSYLITSSFKIFYQHLFALLDELTTWQTQFFFPYFATRNSGSVAST